MDMLDQCNITFGYAQILRRIFISLDDRYLRKNDRGQEAEASSFGINLKRYSAEAFLSIIYLLEDTSDAFDNYLKYGLDGPTKFQDTGEQYLRLYGLLNALNMQYLCCRELYGMFNVPDLKVLESTVKKHIIIKIRNAAASHSVNFEEEGVRDSFRVVQVSISGHGEDLYLNGEKGDISVDLKEEATSFSKIISSELSKISKHLISRFYNQNSKDYQSFSESILVLDNRLGGNKVISSPSGDYIIFSTDPSCLSK